MHELEIGIVSRSRIFSIGQIFDWGQIDWARNLRDEAEGVEEDRQLASKASLLG